MGIRLERLAAKVRSESEEKVVGVWAQRWRQPRLEVAGFAAGKARRCLCVKAWGSIPGGILRGQ